MTVVGLDADRAFEEIRFEAQATGLTVRLISQQFISDVCALTPEDRRDMRFRCRRLLLPAHR